MTEFDGIPITTPARTLLDLASDVTPRELERGFALAATQQLTNRAELLALIANHPRCPGVPLLRAILEAEVGPVLTRSEAEERLLALIRKARLPKPATNAKIAGHEVDFLWRAHRLVVEVDGFAFHSSRKSFESDRLRDAQLAALGFRVVRLTWRQLTNEPEALLARLAQALSVGTRHGGES